VEMEEKPILIIDGKRRLKIIGKHYYKKIGVRNIITLTLLFLMELLKWKKRYVIKA